MAETAISVRNLTKSYGDVEAVKGITFQVNRGEVFAMLGPNGAGKTTTVEILEGHRSRNDGEVAVLEHDPGKGERAYKEKIGIVLQETGVEPFLTVAETVELYRGFYPHPRPVDEIIEVVGLMEKRDERVRKLSGGQQRRLDVAIGLAGDPELLFLDEPTTGFDPGARRGAWQMIRNLRSLGKTVFLTTHYMDEAQNLADNVAIISKGQIVAEGSPRALIHQAEAGTAIRFSIPAGAADLPRDLTQGVSLVDGEVVVQTDTPTDYLNRLTTWALSSGVELLDLTVARPSLEDVYLTLTGGAEQQEPTE